MTDTVIMRPATAADLPAIVAMLADDVLGAARESPDDLAPYEKAFADIEADPSELLAVATLDGAVVGSLQVSWLPGLSHRGALRAQVESVRVAASVRSRGVGEAMMRWVIDQARARDCVLVQLSTHKTRTDAHRFYERLGFTASHLGYKLPL
ncbi:GNAT family N-acetyltransferase [Pseudonocardia acaciae]|uniref:GNAT family N-acetyltransferase n=1 Tax=Pseudonocardia acaciae TaxID=551276 RepID=UPI00048E09B8